MFYPFHFNAIFWSPWKYQLALCIVNCNLFVPNAPFLNSLKISENRKVFWCFRGGRERGGRGVVEKGWTKNKWFKQMINKIKPLGTGVSIWANAMKRNQEREELEDCSPNSSWTIVQTVYFRNLANWKL